jgi:hypothetical protein
MSYSLVPNRTRSARSPVRRPGRCCERKKGTKVMWLASVYSLTVSWTITHLYAGGAWSSQGSILVASIKRCDIIKDIRTDIRTLWGLLLKSVSKHQLYSQEGITPLDNCLCRDRRQPSTASYLVSSLASLLVRKEGKCCYVLMS